MNPRCGVWLCVLIATFLAGCAGPMNQGNVVTAHRWNMINTPPTETWTGELSQVYTYVLIGDGVRGNSNDGVQQAWTSLGKVLEEVAEHSVMPRVGQNSIPLDNLNQFVVPAHRTDQANPALNNYNVDLAHDYVVWFSAALRTVPIVQAKLQGLGPFLIATKRPFPQFISKNNNTWKVSVSEPILLFDLSGVNAIAAPLYIREYKRIIAKGFNATSAPESWRADLASALLRLNDALPRAMVATAQAGNILKTEVVRD